MTHRPTFSAPTFTVLQQQYIHLLLRFSPISPKVKKPIAQAFIALNVILSLKRKNSWVLVLDLLLINLRHDGYCNKQSVPWSAVGGFTEIKHLKPHFPFCNNKNKILKYLEFLYSLDSRKFLKVSQPKKLLI